MADDFAPRAYRVIQLGAPRAPHGTQSNEPVADFDDLVTHHPRSNRNAEMRDGVIVGGQAGRALGYIDGEMQEIEVARGGRTFGLKPDQVLEKKDFILEDPNPPSGPARAVDLPSPIAGHVGRVSEREGLVDILDREGGDVVARIRHMHPIAVAEGETVEYGQALGTQGRQQTGVAQPKWPPKLVDPKELAQPCRDQRGVRVPANWRPPNATSTSSVRPGYR
jgi:hypothetical protein